MTVVIFTESYERILLNVSMFYSIIWLCILKLSIKILQQLVDATNGKISATKLVATRGLKAVISFT